MTNSSEDKETKKKLSDKVNKIIKILNIEYNKTKISEFFTNDNDADELAELSNSLELDNDFEDDIQELLETFPLNEKNIDKLQHLILLFIKKYISKQSKKKSKLEEAELNEEILKDKVNLISKLIVEEYTKKVAIQSIVIEKVKKYLITEEIEVKEFAKRLIKSFSIYELYKIIDPTSIPGEVRLTKFMQNALYKDEIKHLMKHKHDVKNIYTDFKHNIKKHLKNKSITNSRHRDR